MNLRRATSAFTLIELLTVIAIIGILAAIVAPTLNNFRKGDAMLSASRAMLDGVARARQLAISQHTTVYMVFVPPNFWNDNSGGFNTTWFSSLSAEQKVAATNLCSKQLTGYNFVSLRSIGDQPGQYSPRYLAEWQSLPEKAFIPLEKFFYTANYIVGGFSVPAFSYTNDIPFPTEDSPVTRSIYLPYLAFDYLGRVSTNGVDFADGDAFIPLAHGSVAPATDPNKQLLFAAPSVQEQPPGNSTSSSYNLIHVDSLTGRARLERQQVK
jgi:prepilin-type N-terminal cleavage/methylation domain-containing protein